MKSHHEMITELSLIWHSEESIWELSLSSVYSEIVSRMGHDALKLTATELELVAREVRAVFEDDYDREKDLISIGIDNWQLARNL
jgi:hypothetical protein